MAEYLHVVQRKYTKSAMLHRGNTTSMAVVMLSPNGELCFCVLMVSSGVSGGGLGAVCLGHVSCVSG